LSLTGPDGLLKHVTKTVIEAALNEEMTGHLGYGSTIRPARARATSATDSVEEVLYRAQRAGGIEVQRPLLHLHLDGRGLLRQGDDSLNALHVTHGAHEGRSWKVCCGPSHRGQGCPHASCFPSAARDVVIRNVGWSAGSGSARNTAPTVGIDS
jgi:hypothetical protein